jgi:hypothetical protein
MKSFPKIKNWNRIPGTNKVLYESEAGNLYEGPPLREIVDRGGIPFTNRGGRVQVDWSALQKRTHELAEQKTNIEEIP